MQKKNLYRAILASAFAVALGVCTLTGCAPKSANTSSTGTGTQSASTGSSSGTDYTASIDASTIPAVASDADIEKYCENCHFKSDIVSWTASNVDDAVVKSMLFPTINEANNQDTMNAIDSSIAAYFANKQPTANAGQMS